MQWNQEFHIGKPFVPYAETLSSKICNFLKLQEPLVKRRVLFSPFVFFRIRIEHRFLLDTMLPEKFPDIELGFRRNAIFFAIVTIIKRFRKVEDHYFPQMPYRPIRDFFQQ